MLNRHGRNEVGIIIASPSSRLSNRAIKALCVKAGVSLRRRSYAYIDASLFFLHGSKWAQSPHYLPPSLFSSSAHTRYSRTRNNGRSTNYSLYHKNGKRRTKGGRCIYFLPGGKSIGQRKRWRKWKRRRKRPVDA